MSSQKILLLSHENQALLVSTIFQVAQVSDNDGRVKALLDQLQAENAMTELLKAAKENGLDFSQCVREFGEDVESNAFAVAAQNRYCRGSSDNIEIDSHAVISETENGAWVSAWLFINNSEACLSTY